MTLTFALYSPSDEQTSEAAIVGPPGSTTSGRTRTPEQDGCVPATDTNAGQDIVDIFATMRETYAGGTVELTPRTTYTVSNLTAQTVGGTTEHSGGQVFLPPEVMLRANNATLKANAAGSGEVLRGRGEVLGSYIVTGPMSAGDYTFQLATVAEALAFSAGDTVLWRLGDIPYDTPETYNWAVATVTAVNTGTGVITLNKCLSVPWDGTGSASGNALNKHLHRIVPLTGEIIEGVVNCRPSAVGGVTQGAFTMAHGRDVIIGGINSRGARIGVAAAQYIDGFHIHNLVAADSTETGSNQGQASRFAECRGRIDYLDTSNCATEGLAAEAACDIVVGYHYDYNMNPSNSQRRVIHANGRSKVHIERALYVGQGAHLCHSTADDSTVTFGSLRCMMSSDPYSLPMPTRDVQDLQLCINGVEERYIAAQARWFELAVPLTDGMNTTVYGPSGCVAGCYVMCGNGAVAGDVSTFYVARSGGGNDIKASLPAAASNLEVDVGAAAYGTTAGWGSVASAYGWTRRAERVLVSITTPGGSALAGLNKFIRVRWLMVPNALASTLDTVPDETIYYQRWVPTP